MPGPIKVTGKVTASVPIKVERVSWGKVRLTYLGNSIELREGDSVILDLELHG